MKARGRPNYRPVRRGSTKPFKPAVSKTERQSWYPDNWNQLSAEVKAAAGYRCQGHKLMGGKPCGVYAPPPLSSLLNVHHIVPLPRGTSKKSNLIVLCLECHKKIHNDKRGMGATTAQKKLLKKLGMK